MGDLAGGPVIASQTFFTVNNLPVVRLGDIVTPHGDSPHDSALMVGHSPWFTVDGIPVCKTTDLASCGDLLAGTNDWMEVD